MRMRRVGALSSLAMLLVLLVSAAFADVTVPSFFSEHMVLQRGIETPVWGWADPEEKVTVTVPGQTKSIAAGADGKWSVRLAALEAGGPLQLVIQGKNRIEINDVVVGEVWLCSGQSNMAMTVSSSKDFPQEQAAANLPKIRMFTVARETAETPQDRCQGDWKVCSPETVGGFSATAYFFGRELHQQLDVPMGLINSSWGGTPVQAWTSLCAQEAEPKLASMLESWKQQIAAWDPAAAQARYEKQLAAWQKQVEEAKAEGAQAPRKPLAPVDPRKSPHRPASLYDGMIAPLAPYAMQGAIWYQGESNAGGPQADLYGLQLALLIKNWRADWKQGDFPYLWVQLPNFRAVQQQPVEPSGWVTVQEEMRKTLAVPNTGMAITIDVGEAEDIHPKNKQDVGRRLALWALGTTYGKAIVYSGPLHKSACPQDGAVTIEFDHAGDGLKTSDGGPVKGFAIAGEDRSFVFADAKIDGNKVVVSSSQVKSPVAVRYAWASNPVCNLVNSAGLPASPFRTDDWQQQ
ncbi:MAG: sialate O-acetylesterase [Pirellulales bacterium]|nr:sialate O-acetylesterase [Pirellulales bacterium]